MTILYGADEDRPGAGLNLEVIVQRSPLIDQHVVGATGGVVNGHTSALAQVLVGQWQERIDCHGAGISGRARCVHERIVQRGAHDRKTIVAAKAVNHNRLGRPERNVGQTGNGNIRGVEPRRRELDRIGTAPAVDDHRVTAGGRIAGVDRDIARQAGRRARIVQIDHVAAGVAVDHQVRLVGELNDLEFVHRDLAGVDNQRRIGGIRHDHE